MTKAVVIPFAVLFARVFWQLPTYDGTKSYQNLLVGVYGGQEGIDWLSTRLDTVTQNIPINLIRNGYYKYDSGSISSRNNYGYYWWLQASSNMLAMHLRLNATALYSQHHSHKGAGYSLRCLVSLASRQLPTYDGTKSYQNLLVGVYGTQTSTSTVTTINSDSILQLSPTSFIRNGRYNHDSGRALYFNERGNYWQSESYSITHARDIVFFATTLNPRDGTYMGVGLSLRCLVR